jgi:hypothetical protein
MVDTHRRPSVQYLLSGARFGTAQRLAYVAAAQGSHADASSVATGLRCERSKVSGVTEKPADAGRGGVRLSAQQCAVGRCEVRRHLCRRGSQTPVAAPRFSGSFMRGGPECRAEAGGLNRGDGRQSPGRRGEAIDMTRARSSGSASPAGVAATAFARWVAARPPVLSCVRARTRGARQRISPSRRP